ncbi:hypothetical protein BDQ12DRAFT_701391 [Crucibulum laeve]|uniref:Uncharacterized protein n=1 Tax=Crucibulum laeve TaxID=68775 RepID=A0A5C3LJ65_9AGAR|nr:hypothetical protein BDQ12DRAFT_701391 [Crucibulum laeve]
MASLPNINSVSAAVQAPELDVVTLARTTRKTLERLAPFCLMRNPSQSDAGPIINKIITKINAYIRAIDGSMLAMQLAYRLAEESMVLCDPGVAEWEVSSGPSSTVPREGEEAKEALRALAEKGWEEAKKTSEVFAEVSQDIYKIAASTKDNAVVVLVPPDPGHPSTLRKPLKEVGSDLVANLSLLSRFASDAADVASWWSAIKDELSAISTTPQAREQGNLTAYMTWEKRKKELQLYYDVVNVAQTRYPELLHTSISAWQSVTSARPTRSTAPSVASGSLPNSRSPSPVSAPRKTRSVGGFIMFGKGIDRESAEDRTKEKRVSGEGKPTLVKRVSYTLMAGVRYLCCCGCMHV